MPAKILRASVIVPGEWYKDRDLDAWRKTRQQALLRDRYACVYCRWVCRTFMQVNHIGAEDNHGLDNLETVCAACHSVLHLGISAMEGLVSLFDCSPTVTDMAVIVRATRAMVMRNMSWLEIERRILERFALPEGRFYTKEETIQIANEMLSSIPPGEYRGYLPPGRAVLFHEGPEWNGFPDAVCRWQCVKGSSYLKDEQQEKIKD